MKSQFRSLFGFAALAAVATAAESSCVDCEAPLVANADWSNGVLAQGNYYSPTKTGNWLLGNTAGGTGPLELRNDPAIGNYVWNFCPKGQSGYCRVFISQVITVQAGVTYDFAIQYAVDGVRAQADIFEFTVDTLPTRARLFNGYTYSGNTNGWATFNTPPWTPTEARDVLVTLTWRNDPNDATVKIRSARMTPVECRDAASTKTCSLEPEPTTTSTTTSEPEPTTTTTSTSTLEPEPTTTTTSETEPTTTTSTSEIESTTSTTSATSSSATLSPTKSCKRKRRSLKHSIPNHRHA